MRCRHCKSSNTKIFLDLGYAPPSNQYLHANEIDRPHTYFPLRVGVCHDCWLVQTQDFTDAHILFDNDYAYFSSTSSSWLIHAKNYVDTIISRLHLHSQSKVVEIASNDGYLLQNFLDKGIPCYGVEPTLSTALRSEELGIKTVNKFFSNSLAAVLSEEEGHADLIIANNVYAHVPDINDFTRGIKTLLKPNGTVTIEFPHLLNLIRDKQFDTIYHEHFSYLSLGTVSRIFKSQGLRVFDVEELQTHGGSLRVLGCHRSDDRTTSEAVSNMIELEIQFGLESNDIFDSFQYQAELIKQTVNRFLWDFKSKNKTVVAYGAAAKGNTLLNFSGISRFLLPIVFDAAPSKQGKYLPGTGIPIANPFEAQGRLDARLHDADVIIVLPWNISDEIVKMLRTNGCAGQIFTLTPEPELVLEKCG